MTAQPVEGEAGKAEERALPLPISRFPRRPVGIGNKTERTYIGKSCRPQRSCALPVLAWVLRSERPALQAETVPHKFFF